MTNIGCDQTTKTTLKNLDDAIANLQTVSDTLRQHNPVNTETVKLSDALNRILSKDIYSDINVPPENNSAVDGYALCLDEFTPNTSMFISQQIPAGSVPQTLEKQTVARIFTGAHIPEGANCVVMQENTSLSADKTQVLISETPKLFQNIRPRGQDIKNGDQVLCKGDVLSPQRLGLIASIGLADVEIFKPLTVAILSTGDELVEPGNIIKEGQIFNSNRYLLSGFLKSLHFNVLDYGVVPDQLDSTLSALEQAASRADIIITTGGASVGEKDYIQSAIRTLGDIDFWKVAIKPGKPVMLGNIAGTPILGLPGNPGAVFVTFMILARPFLLHQQGLNNTRTKSYSLPINFDIKKAGIRREFLRVVRRNGMLELHSNQSSGMLSSASWAEGLAVIVENTAPKKGDIVDFLPFDNLLNLNH